MKKSIISSALKVISGAMVIAFAAILPLFPLSCKLSDDDSTESESTSSENANKETENPVSNGKCSAIDEKTIRLEIAEGFSLVNGSISVSEKDSSEAITEIEDIVDAETENVKKIVLKSETEVGKTYVLSGSATDSDEKTYDFSYDFTGYNKNMARLILSEVRTEYKKTQSAAEFIEFYALKGGNLCGLEFACASKVTKASGEQIYKFPDIKVKTGDYITVHLRTLEDGSINEINGDCTESTAPDSHDSAWDLWIDGSEDKLVTQFDVILLRNSESYIYDALLMADSSKIEWKNTFYQDFANKASKSGIWVGGEYVKNAVDVSASNSYLRSVSRQDIQELSEKYSDGTKIPDIIQNEKSKWIVTASKTKKNPDIGATPGYKNSTTPIGN